MSSPAKKKPTRDLAADAEHVLTVLRGAVRGAPTGTGVEAKDLATGLSEGETLDALERLVLEGRVRSFRPATPSSTGLPPLRFEPGAQHRAALGRWPS